MATNPGELSKRFHLLPGLTGRRELLADVSSNVSGIFMSQEQAMLISPTLCKLLIFCDWFRAGKKVQKDAEDPYLGLTRSLR